MPARSAAREGGGPVVEHPDRLAAIVRQNATFVWRILRRLGVPESEADDASQQVFLTFARKLPTVERGRERSFLFSIVVRTASNERRKIDRRKEDFDDAVARRLPSPALSPYEALELAQARRLLDLVLAAMPLAVRAAFVLFEIEDLSLAEVSDLLEIPRGTVASRLRRAREILEVEVGRLKGEGGRGGR